MSHLSPLPKTFTAVVAVREFEISCSNDVHPYRVEIGQPIQDVETAGGRDWRCPVRFIENGAARVQSAGGADSFQALRLAFDLVRAELHFIVQGKDVELRFLGETYDSACL